MDEEVFNERYKKLNKHQKKAVDSVEGPVLVVAGPGSGKTEILSLRVANILRQTDTPPHGILCLTFTDAAAVNMRRRLQETIGLDAYRVSIHTFHNFGVHVIERWPEYFYKGAFFKPADPLVQTEIIEGIFASLPHDNPLSSVHPEQGYVYLYDTLRAIASLKKAGLTPDEFEKIIDHNEQSTKHLKDDLDSVFSATLSKKVLPSIAALLTKMTEYPSSDFPVDHVSPLLPSLARSLERALEQVLESGKTVVLSEWKKRHTKKEGENRILTTEYYVPRMKALAHVYKEYQQFLYTSGYYDFDDMLLDVISALLNDSSLKAELQEQFLYILVDEFQDTNDAQMRLLKLLADNPVVESKPNIMVVGDDDQAIYKFQGAELSNILSFKEQFLDPTIITMTDNYRSRQDILDVARSIITQGTERLENVIPEMQKSLTASNTSIAGGTIEHHIYPTRIHEYDGVAEAISNALEKGVSPEGIAVIARRHRDLESLVPFLYEKGIPIRYDRQQNVFTEPHIHELIQMSRFIVSLSSKDDPEADELLPEILSFPFWGIDRTALWELSIAAQGKDWIEVMKHHDNSHFQAIADFFISLATRSRVEPVEYILDSLIGAHVELVSDTNDADIEPENIKSTPEFLSPYKEYYFSKEEFEEKKTEYLRFLSSLKVFVEAIREYKSGSLLKLTDLVSFVDLHEKNNLLVTDTSPFSNAEDAVQLLTAHKAKGLEFDTVFVLSAADSIWAKSSGRNLLPFPENLPIAPTKDNHDDNLRLFYVAVTRAKRELYISSYKFDDAGKESLSVQFLHSAPGIEALEKNDSIPNTHTLLETTVPGYHSPPFVKEEKGLLLPLVEKYQLSVTHFNNFLDVSKGGPRLFLEQNLLRFPQPKSISGVYGSVIHETLRRAYLSIKSNSKKPKVIDITQWYEEELSKQRLSENDFKRYLKRGKDALQVYYKEKKDTFDQGHMIEYNFRQQGVVIGEAHLTGKIDKMVMDKDTVTVHDFKTGKALSKWNDNDTKLWRYKNQLLFYKLLVENSREFKKRYSVEKGVLEFIEPLKGSIIDLLLDIDTHEVERLSKLVEIVFQKIKTLDFPDTSEYSPDIKGIRAFEDDLLTN